MIAITAIVFLWVASGPEDEPAAPDHRVAVAG